MGENETHHTFCCPLCGVETDIPAYEFVTEPEGKIPPAAERKRIGLENRARSS